MGEVLRRLEERGMRQRELEVEEAFHSPLMEPLLERLEEAAGRVEVRAPEGCLVSDLSGEMAGEEVREARYWRRHAREEVRFWAGLRATEGGGAGVDGEGGPGAALPGL